MCLFEQENDNLPQEMDTKTSTPLTSPVKLSRNNITHASSAPSSVGVSSLESRDAPLLAQADFDEGEKNKKKVQHMFLIIIISNAVADI